MKQTPMYQKSAYEATLRQWLQITRLVAIGPLPEKTTRISNTSETENSSCLNSLKNPKNRESFNSVHLVATVPYQFTTYNKYSIIWTASTINLQKISFY
jgi:hypothetical protein